jgi:lipopolysaccharide export system protein LptA
LLFGSISAVAQKPADTSKTIAITVQNARTYVGTQTAAGMVNKLIGDVRLEQQGSLMACDSAYLNQEANNLEAFGNVVITQPGGTQVQSDYLRYTGNTRQAYLQGNVSLTDGKNNLWVEELEYDLGTKIGVYTQGGTLQSENTTLSSNAGNYNVKTKDARFTGEVIVTDPQYNVTSTDLGYNTATKFVRFFGPSIITTESSELRTSNGTWDPVQEVAHFITRSSIRNKEQFIEADKIDYNRKSGEGVSVGNVVAIDTTQHTTLFCGYARYNEITKKMLATVKPIMRQMNNNDSLFMRADTFLSAPVPKAKDTAAKATTKVTSKKTIGKNVTETTELTVADTTAADSTQPRYFIGYHHVLVYSDSLQARCDSISYTQSDSTMRLMYNPVAWSRNSQITGDTILLYMDSSKLRKLYVPNNALVVSQSGPDKAKMYDQVQGKTLTGYFEKNAIKELIVWPAAEVIYYSKDDDGAYLGMSQAESERMRVYFENEQMTKIVLEQEPKQTMTPMQQVNIAGAKLSRFQWLIDKRPKSVQELFDYEPETTVKEKEKTEEKKEEKPKKETRKKRKNR